MSDPIATLQRLEPESPPEEVVLSAVRLFRYRTIAAVSVTVAVIVALGLSVRVLQNRATDDPAAVVVEDAAAVHEVVDGSATAGGVRVSATELIVADEDAALRLVFEDLDPARPEPELDIEVVEVASGTASTSLPSWSIRSLGRQPGRSSTAAWIDFPRQMLSGQVTVRLFVLPIPQSVLEEGGVLTSDDGFTVELVIERER